MGKDINIHIKTEGEGETKQQLKEVGASAQKLGRDVSEGQKTGAAATEQASGKMRSALKTLGGALGFAGLAATAIAAIRRIIRAIDDMKRAVSEAVTALAQQQKAAADFFEAFEAWSPEQRKAALTQAYKFQGRTGLDLGASKNLLEAYKRTFGAVDEAALDQLAGYWKLHAQEATLDLVRWMGAEGIKSPERQGQIMRMISATATGSKLRDPEIIRGLVQRSSEFRGLGWTPEQTIANIGKVLSGLSGREARMALTGMVEGLKTFTEEKAIEMKAPEAIAGDEGARIRWAAEYMRGLPEGERRRFALEAFGKTYGTFVQKLLIGEDEQTRRMLAEAASPEAAAEEAERVAAERRTAESLLAQTEGVTGPLAIEVSEKEKRQAVIREYGKRYYEYLRRTDRIKYELLQGLPEQMRYERAAEMLWQTIQPEVGRPEPPTGLAWRGMERVKPRWKEVSSAERIEELEEAVEKLTQAGSVQVIHNHNHYDYSNRWYPRTGMDDPDMPGPRFEQY